MGYDRSRFEILSPAGNPDKLRAAVAYGADAVYLSGQSYGLRAFSDNFSEDEMKAGIAYDGVLQEKCKDGFRRMLDNKTAFASFENAAEFESHKEGVIASVVCVQETLAKLFNAE